MAKEKQQPRIVHHNPHRPRPSKGRTFTQVSKTIPDDSLTIRQILDRFGKTNTVGVTARDGTFDADYPIPDVQSLDLVERAELVAEQKEYTKRFVKKPKQETIDVPHVEVEPLTPTE